MILIDSRSGSGELLPYFKKHNIPTQLSTTDLPAGDFMFEGYGPENKRIMIGVERKAIRDLITSIRSGRLAGHQMPALKDMYARSFIVVEGVWGPGRNGLLEEPRRIGGKTSWVPLTIGGSGYMYSMVDRFIVSIEESYRGHIRFHRTSNKEETVEHLVNIYIEYQKLYTSRFAWDATTDVEIEIKPWTLARRIAGRFPGIAGRNSQALAKAFGEISVDMVNASEEELAEIMLPSGEGHRRLGKTLAKKIYEGLRKPE